MTVIKILIQAMHQCRELALPLALIGNPQIVSECKGFEDTRSWTFFDSMDDARSSFSRSVATVPVTAATS